MLRKHKDAVGMTNKKLSQNPLELLPVKDLLHFDVLLPCVDRIEPLSATDSKHLFLLPRLAFCRAEGCFAVRKCSIWRQQFSAAKAGLSCVLGWWALALPAPGCM